MIQREKVAPNAGAVFQEVSSAGRGDDGRKDEWHFFDALNLRLQDTLAEDVREGVRAARSRFRDVFLSLLAGVSLVDRSIKIVANLCTEFAAHRFECQESWCAGPLSRPS